MTEKPSLIVLTPVRNEAWVLDAFLTCTSSWADHIIIADHHSDDGSREIAAKYGKVTLIDNPCHEWVEYECRARLLEEAAKIPGDKIIFGIDADEFLSEGFEKTEGWKQIVNSKPNEIFCLGWMNLYDDFCKYDMPDYRAEWIAHYGTDVDIVAEYRSREHHSVHCARVPCLETDRCRYTMIDDIKFVHLAKLNHQRVQNKVDFYQVVWHDKNEEPISCIAVYRGYNQYYPACMEHRSEPVRLCCFGNDEDLCSLVKMSDNGLHYIEEIKQIFARRGSDYFALLGIWDNPYLKDLAPKMALKYRFLHWYLRVTQKYYPKKSLVLLDKVLKRFYR